MLASRSGLEIRLGVCWGVGVGQRLLVLEMTLWEGEAKGRGHAGRGQTWTAQANISVLTEVMRPGHIWSEGN